MAPHSWYRPQEKLLSWANIAPACVWQASHCRSYLSHISIGLLVTTLSKSQRIVKLNFRDIDLAHTWKIRRTYRGTSSANLPRRSSTTLSLIPLTPRSLTQSDHTQQTYRSTLPEKQQKHSHTICDRLSTALSPWPPRIVRVLFPTLRSTIQWVQVSGKQCQCFASA